MENTFNNIFNIIDETAKNSHIPDFNFTLNIETIKLNNGGNYSLLSVVLNSDLESRHFLNNLKNSKHLLDLNFENISVICHFDKDNMFDVSNNYSNIEYNDFSTNPQNLFYRTDISKNIGVLLERVYRQNHSKYPSGPYLNEVMGYLNKPKLLFFMKDSFLLPNIFNFLEKKDLSNYSTNFTFNIEELNIQDMYYNGNFRYASDNDLVRHMVRKNYSNDSFGDDSFQYLMQIKDNKVVYKNGIDNNLNNNFHYINYIEHNNKDILFKSSHPESLSNLVTINSSHRDDINGFVLCNEEGYYSQTNMHLNSIPGIYEDYQHHIKDTILGKLNQEEREKIFCWSILILNNLHYKIDTLDLREIKNKIAHDLVFIGKNIITTLFDVFKRTRVTFSILSNFKITNTSLYKEDIRLTPQGINKISLIDLFKKSNYLGRMTSNLLNQLSPIFGSSLGISIDSYEAGFNSPDKLSLIPFYDFYQMILDVPEDKRLYLDKLNLGKIFKREDEHFVLKKKSRSKYVQVSMVPNISDVFQNGVEELIIVDDTKFKSRKLKLLHNRPKIALLEVKSIPAELILKGINFKKLHDRYAVNWLSEKLFKEEDLKNMGEASNVPVRGFNFIPNLIGLNLFSNRSKLGHYIRPTTIPIDNESIKDISIVSIHINNDNALAIDRNKLLKDNNFTYTHFPAFLYLGLMKIIEQAVQDKFGKPVKIYFSTKQGHNKLLKNGAIDFLEIKESNYYGKGEEYSTQLSSIFFPSEMINTISNNISKNIFEKELPSLTKENLKLIGTNSMSSLMMTNFCRYISLLDNETLNEFPLFKKFIDMPYPELILRSFFNGDDKYYNKYNKTFNQEFGLDFNLETDEKRDLDLAQKQVLDSFLNKIDVVNLPKRMRENFNYFASSDDTDYEKDRNSQYMILNSKKKDNLLDSLAQKSEGNLFSCKESRYQALKLFEKELEILLKHRCMLSEDNILKLEKDLLLFKELLIKNFEDYYNYLTT